LTLSNTSSFLTWSVQLIFSILLQHHISKIFQVFLICCSERPSFSTIQSYAPDVTPHQSLPHSSYCFIKIQMKISHKICLTRRFSIHCSLITVAISKKYY
jgi:hypothetical protein